MSEVLHESDTLERFAPSNAEQPSLVPMNGAQSYQDKITTIQEAVIQIQGAAIEVQKSALSAVDVSAKEVAIALQLSATKLLKAAMSLELEAIAMAGLELPRDPASCCEKGSEQLAAGQIQDAMSYFRAALETDPQYAPAHKGLGDCLLQSGDTQEAMKSYETALQYRPEYPEVENNLALAYLAKFDHRRAETAFQRILLRDHGLSKAALQSFDGAIGGDETPVGYASPFKLIDRVDQLSYLLDRKKLHKSFEGLVDAYRNLSAQLQADENRVPYSPLPAPQLKPFKGYYDKLLHYRDTPRLNSAAVNPDIDWKSIEEEYLDTRCLSFDDFLTPAALDELRQFFLESTIFFRHSEAGFVGTYVTDGFCPGLIFQVIDELRARLPRLLTDKPLNNMWCYRYNDRGHGVRPHNGDGSVTINFYLTPDEANIGDRNGGGMVMYDKEHPSKWDWLTFNLHKDDPGIQALISEYLQDAKATTVPYRNNRAVLFHSTLFHKTDPFHFRDDYESRRMNITMLFGRRGQESAPLK